MHIMMWDCDGIKVLDLQWDEFGTYRLRPLKTHWWEEKFDDISFWDGKVDWNTRSVPEDIAGVDCESFCASLPYLHKRRLQLRQDAKHYAISRMYTCYVNADHERGTSGQAYLLQTIILRPLILRSASTDVLLTAAN